MGAQQGIFIEGNTQHWFLEFTVDDPDGVSEAVGAILAEALGTVTTDRVQVVLSFGHTLARRLFPDDVPDEFRPFVTIAGPAQAAPATEVDLFVWVHSDRHDRNYDVALCARRAIEAIGSVVQDVPAWQFHDSRDLTGFIDGTENPTADEARELVVADAAAGHDGGTGGSYVFTQRWVHDLDAFHALPIDEQQRVIGRTKPDSVELDPLPDDSHVGRVVIEDDEGEELELYRRSVPYGNTTEAGLFFLAFPGDLGLIDAMLERMFGLDGPPDRLIDFSQAVSGAFTFAPSTEALTRLIEQN